MVHRFQVTSGLPFWSLFTSGLVPGIPYVRTCSPDGFTGAAAARVESPDRWSLNDYLGPSIHMKAGQDEADLTNVECTFGVPGGSCYQRLPGAP
jgi:hypothetical protein